MNLHQLIEFKRGKNFKLPPRLLCIDPGHTTGWSFFVNGELMNSGESFTIIDNKEHNWSALDDLFDTLKPSHVVCEDYRMYANKSQQHIGQKTFTLRLIGVIDYRCYHDEVPIYYQMAATAKSFWSDDKLKQLGMLPKSKHARDSIRHGLQLMTFNKEYKGE